jgi:hypothetical protein
MRTVIGVGVMLLAFVPSVRAQDEMKAVLEKAVKAHGGKENLAKVHAIKSASNGTIDLFGGLEFSQESITDLPKQFKETVFVETNGTRRRTVTVLIDGKGWTTASGSAMDIEPAVLEEIKQAIHLMELGTLRFVDHKDFVLSPLGNSTVAEKPVFGIKVERKGFRDAKLYFSRETGLLVKIDRQAYDTVTMRDVVEERHILDYQDVAGVKVARKIEVKRDGKRFMTAEITDVKFLDNVDPAEFVRPEK